MKIKIIKICDREDIPKSTRYRFLEQVAKSIKPVATLTLKATRKVNREKWVEDYIKKYDFKCPP